MLSTNLSDSTSVDYKMKPEMVKVSLDQFGKWFYKNLLLVLTFSGVFLGLIIGVVLRSADLDKQTILYIAYPGELFMRLLKLMILPLIIASLITGNFIYFFNNLFIWLFIHLFIFSFIYSGAASLNAKLNGMIAIRTIVYFLATSLISALIGNPLFIYLLYVCLFILNLRTRFGPDYPSGIT